MARKHVSGLLQPASLETEIQYTEDSIPPGSTPDRPSLQNKFRNKIIIIIIIIIITIIYCNWFVTRWQ